MGPAVRWHALFGIRHPIRTGAVSGPGHFSWVRVFEGADANYSVLTRSVVHYEQVRKSPTPNTQMG